MNDMAHNLQAHPTCKLRASSRPGTYPGFLNRGAGRLVVLANSKRASIRPFAHCTCRTENHARATSLDFIGCTNKSPMTCSNSCGTFHLQHHIEGEEHHPLLDGVDDGPAVPRRRLTGKTPIRSHLGKEGWTNSEAKKWLALPGPTIGHQAGRCGLQESRRLDFLEPVPQGSGLGVPASQKSRKGCTQVHQV